MKRGDNPATLQAAENLGVVAEFIQRPGAGDLLLVWDLGYTLVAWNIEDPVETFDRSGVEYTDAGRVFIGNGVPDAAELYLLQTVLKRPDLDLSARSGVVEEFAWQAWSANLTQVQNDLPGLDPRIQRTVAAYMTLGDYWTASSMKDMVETAYPGVTLDIDQYDRSRQKFLNYHHDADNDGVTNLEEWQAASPDGSLANVEAFADASLDGVRPTASGGGGNSGSSGSSSSCFNQACVGKSGVTALTFPSPPLWPLVGEATASPSGPQNLGTKIEISANATDPAYSFQYWTSGTPTMVQGSRELADSLRLMEAAGDSYVIVDALFGRAGLAVPANVTVTGNAAKTYDDDGHLVVDECGNPIYFGPINTIVTLTASAPANQRVIGWCLTGCCGCADPRISYSAKVTLPLGGYAAPIIATESPKDLVTITLHGGQGGQLLGDGSFWWGGAFLNSFVITPGYSLSLSQVPNAGYEVVNPWTGHLGTPGELDTSVAGSAAFSTTFKEAEEYTLEIEDSGGSEGDPSCAGYVSVKILMTMNPDRSLEENITRPESACE